MYKIAVTGHRNLLDAPKVRTRLINYFTKNKAEIELVYTGMALGFDILVAEICLDLGIPLMGCIPFVGHTSRWSAAQKHDYDLLLAKMNQVGNCKVVVVTPGDLSEYHDVCKALFARNEFMIDRADRVLACYDGRDTGGTKGAIAYAKKKKKVVGNILDFRI